MKPSQKRITLTCPPQGMFPLNKTQIMIMKIKLFFKSFILPLGLHVFDVATDVNLVIAYWLSTTCDNNCSLYAILTLCAVVLPMLLQFVRCCRNLPGTGKLCHFLKYSPPLAPVMVHWQNWRAENNYVNVTYEVGSALFSD